MRVGRKCESYTWGLEESVRVIREDWKKADERANSSLIQLLFLNTG